MLSRLGGRGLVRFCHTGPFVQNRFLDNGAKATGLFDENGQLTEGSILAGDGSKRVGVFEDGKLVEGRVQLPDGRVYSGRFKEGALDPATKGKLQEDGSVYTGQFNASWQRHGKGKETGPDGTVHEGMFEEDYLVEGTVTIPETDARPEVSFRGTLREGQFVKGVLNFNGMEYEGDIARNNPHGKGRLVMPDGSVRSGTFENGLLHGDGQIVLKNGTLLKGRFNKGHLPHGEVKWPNGDFYEGDLDRQHRPEGDGTMFRAAPSHWWSGQWKSGTFSGGSVTDSEGCPVDYRQASSEL